MTQSTQSRSESGLILPSYRRDVGSHPPLDFAGYGSTALRHPKQPLQLLPHYLTEVTGPLLGHDRVGEAEAVKQARKLSPQQARRAREHESSHKGRKTVLRQLDKQIDR